MRFPRRPLPLANCSFLEDLQTALHTTIYMCSQHGISPQLSCRPLESLPAHVMDTVPRSQALSFLFGAGGRISVAKVRTLMIHFIFSTSACRISSCQDPLQLIRASYLPVSRVWTRAVVNGPRPCGRYCHTVALVGSNLFVFGGQIDGRRFNDIWSFNLNHCTFAPRCHEPFLLDIPAVKSSPLWESYGPAPGDRKPTLRSGHVSVTTGDRIIVFVPLSSSPSPLIIMSCRFGGDDYPRRYNDTWSFDISTRKWTELQCTGSIPSPRVGYAAVLIDDAMYVFGGYAVDGTNLGDLAAFNLSSKWFGMFSLMRSLKWISSSAMDHISRHGTKSKREAAPCHGI